LPAYLDDFAYLVWGLLELYQASFQPDYLEKAIWLTDQMLDLFGDQEEGGFFFYGWDAEKLISRPKELYDGALPSGNSVATLNLLRLAHLTGEQRFADWGWRQLNHFARVVNQFPIGYSFFLTALQFVWGTPKEIVVVGEKPEQNTQTFLNLLQETFLPEAVLHYSPSPPSEKLKKIVPYIEHYQALDGQPTVYVCENYACHQPVTSPEQLRQYF
ncbi:MAG: thioredoxin domain-containing protein, partial [Syntrophomonadaceae bacterium]|nr:thioredoxin domain-containing protein [Syntrophomonadaceae bacterium]